MNSAHSYAIVLVTTPNLKVARKLVSLALRARLVACGNLVPKIESHYWWNGKIERSGEVLVLFKTTSAKLDGLEKLLLANHPYDTAEVIAVKLTQGTARYLDWVSTSLRPLPRQRS